MSKKGTRALASATLMSLVLTSALSAGPVHAAAGQVTRTSGADRYATAAQVAKANWATGSKDVVLVTGEGYADAVSASALAKQLNAPILLTTSNSLSDDAKSALETLKPQNIYIVGGNAAVSQSVRDGLKTNYNLVELGGKNRYETNVAVANKLVELGVKADNVMLVGGEGFSDALSVAPVAAAKGQILLLGSNNAETMESVINFVKTNSSKVTVVGTTNIISEDMYKAIGAVDRVNGGASRFETNMNVLNKYAADLKADKLFVANASGNGYADALVASALAGKTASPLVLVDSEGTTATTTAINYIKSIATKTTDLNVVGGEGVVSKTTVDTINEAVNPTTPAAETTVKSIEATDLNQIKVVYNTEVDSDSAEEVTNYKVDGLQLTQTTAKAVLQDDNKTVLITLSEPTDQYKDSTVSVKNGVLTADKSKSIAAFDKTVTFSDTVVPTLKSVTVQGNNKLTVEFSEPVNMANITTLAQKFKINGQSITSFGLSTTASLTEIKDKLVGTGNYASSTWSSKVEFYFDSALPSGNNTLKVSDGDKTGVLVDAAGFTFKEASMNFNVDTVSTNPAIKEIKADADGTLWVRFDRPMDKKTAVLASNYGLNGDSVVLPNDGVLKEGDNTVKFTGVKFNTGANTLYIANSVKDAYGNKVADDTRVSFTQVKDETKPTVTGVSVIDSETIRVKFSKDIDANYATQTSNYKLKDASDVDISSHILQVKTSSGVSGNSDTWDIKIAKNPHAKDSSNPDTTTDWRLTGSKYTLTIKNLADTTNNTNVMDDYTTTLTGQDDIAPKVTKAIQKADSSKVSGLSDTKVVVYFSEAMNADTIGSATNFRYVNGTGDSKAIPSSTKFTVNSDNKSVTIEFPSNYKVNGSGIDNDNIVNGIVVVNSTDLAGNVIDPSNSSAKSIVAATDSGNGTIALKDNSYRMMYDGDDILVKVQYNSAIDTDTIASTDFFVAGENPDSISVSGSDLVLRFGKDSKSLTTKYADLYAATAYSSANPKATTDFAKKVDVIKKQGANAALTIAATPATSDVSGIKISNTGATNVYDLNVAPKTSSDYWYAVQKTDVSGTNKAAVVLTFDTALYENSGIRPDDFTFTTNGQEVKADKVVVKGNTVIFDFEGTKSDAFTSDANIAVTLKNTGINLTATKDADGNYAKYTPSNDDKTKTRTVKVDGTATIDFATLFTN